MLDEKRVMRKMNVFDVKFEIKTFVFATNRHPYSIHRWIATVLYNKKLGPAHCPPFLAYLKKKGKDFDLLEHAFPYFAQRKSRAKYSDYDQAPFCDVDHLCRRQHYFLNSPLFCFPCSHKRNTQMHWARKHVSDWCFLLFDIPYTKEDSAVAEACLRETKYMNDESANKKPAARST
mmetsp:Transcript_38162/g.92346  ORF Transcript_38162/g.92346 Transcript_38162/m.92346 type:complete len:176 (+) Transcript_38162:2096-2623(+)